MVLRSDCVVKFELYVIVLRTEQDKMRYIFCVTKST